MKKKNILAIALFVVYLLVLVWILLFKFSLSLDEINQQLQSGHRSLNLIPFSQSVIINGQLQWSEIIQNLLIFLPFGGLLGIVAKKSSFIKKIGWIFFFSLGIEVCQYIFGLGATDITDVIINTAGGLCGLVLYTILSKIFNEQKLDRVLTFLGTIIFTFCSAFVFFVIFSNR